MGSNQDHGKRVTSRDVAAYAGVSQNTVSLVLRNSPLVREETADRVREAIAALGYRPNALAAALKGQRALTIGLVMQSPLVDQFAAIVADTIVTQAYHAGYRVLVDTFGKTAASMRADELLATRQIDGAIVHALGHYTQYLSRLAESGAPFVALGDSPRDLEISCVRVNDGAGAYEAVMHLIRLGHTCIGAIAPHGFESKALAAQRLNGYMNALRRHNLPVDESLVAPAEHWDLPSGFAAMQTLLARPRSQRPTAIFAFSDMLAIGAMSAIHQAGLRIPQDIAVVSFDNIPQAEYTIPRLTTVHYPMRDMAQGAFSLLLDQIHGSASPTQSQKIILPTTLVIRDSCGANLVRTEEASALAILSE